MIIKSAVLSGGLPIIMSIKKVSKVIKCRVPLRWQVNRINLRGGPSCNGFDFPQARLALGMRLGGIKNSCAARTLLGWVVFGL